MTDGRVLVRRPGRGEVDVVTDVLAESFRDYPVMRFVLGRAADEPHAEHYNRSLRTLVHATSSSAQ